MVEPLPIEPQPSTVASTAARSTKSRLSWPLSAALAILLTCGTVATATVIRFGSIRNGIDYANGIRLTVDNRTKSIGVATPLQRINISFRLTNMGGEPVRVMGCQTDCSCVAVESEPFDLAPGQSRAFDVNMEMASSVGPVERNITLFTNIPDQEQIKLAVVGRIESPAKN